MELQRCQGIFRENRVETKEIWPKNRIFQEGICNDAKVIGNSGICNDAEVIGNKWICNGAELTGNSSG